MLAPASWKPPLYKQRTVGATGYGESLIDYDAHIERFGVGVLMTDLL